MQTQLSFVFLGAQLSANFLKIAFLKKGCHSFLLCCKFCNFLFGLLKHYKIGVSAKCWFFVVAREEAKKITGISELVFLSKTGRFVTHICFSKNALLNPLFIVFFGCALFGPSCQKREILDTHQKKKNLTDN